MPRARDPGFFGFGPQIRSGRDFAWVILGGTGEEGRTLGVGRVFSKHAFVGAAEGRLVVALNSCCHRFDLDRGPSVGRMAAENAFPGHRGFVIRALRVLGSPSFHPPLRRHQG